MLIFPVGGFAPGGVAQRYLCCVASGGVAGCFVALRYLSLCAW